MATRIRFYRAAALLLAVALLMAGLSSGVGEGSGSAQVSSNLADFLDSVEITGAEKNEAGQYVIVEGVPYKVQMFFSEKVSRVQFDTDSGVLTYAFPNGFTPLDEEGNVEMTGEGGSMRFHYVIHGNTLTVTFDRTSPGYASFVTSESAEFEIHTQGVISAEEVMFSSEVSGQFNIDDERKVSVRKIGEYDATLNKVKFTVQATSKGNNTNVHIGDIILGSALTFDPGSLAVSSSISDPVDYTPDTQTGETFGLTVPSMAHGEVITVEYYADVDLDGLENVTGVEVTGNEAKVTSQQNPTGDDITISNEDFQNKITLSTNSKTASGQTVRDGKTYVTWTIVLNENANISIAGSTVTDTIDDASQPYMRYSGRGIHIVKYRKDGSEAGTSDIAWGAGGLSASQGGSAWTYTIPSTDAGNAYRYVITYETEVDSEDFLKTTTVSNTVHNEYDTDHGADSVGTTGDEMEADKSAVHSTVDAINKTAETEWEITFTVPAAGLDSAVVTDSLPGILNTAENRWFYDAYKEGSVRVREGDLAEGEGFSVESKPQDHQVVITFTKDGGQPGLTGTGLARTIHVYLTTTASHDWLVYAETLGWARKHVNNAVVRLNGQDFNVTGTASYNTTAYDLKKEYRGTYYTADTDPQLPIYVYRIVLKNVNADAFDSEGYITITDDYDSDYLFFQSAYSIAHDYEVYKPNGRIYGNTQWNTDSLMYEGEYVVDSSSTEGHLVFRINRDDLPMDGVNYYFYYSIYYALRVKDAQTLDRMKEEALHSEGLHVQLENIASNDQFGTSAIVTEYTVNALEKTLVSEQDNSETGTHDLHFKIVVNDDGLKIGDEDTITVKDTLSNLSFDYTTIEVEPQLEGDVVNRVGNSVVFTLHNETRYQITYTARLIGIQNVQWNNKADLYGHTSGVNGTSSSQSGGSGSYHTYSMNVLKYAEGNMNQGLAATFELHEARVKDGNGNDIPNPSWVKVAEFTTDEATGRYAISAVERPGATAAQSLRPYSYHDDDGVEQFGGGTSEAYGWRYRIVETAAPEGYQKTDVAYEFGISDIPSYVAPYNYLNSDTVTIVNKPVGTSVQTAIPGKKVLNGKALEDQEFTFSLTPEPGAEAAWGEGRYPGGFDGALTATNDAEGRFSFPLSYTYEDYMNAERDDDQCAYFYYVVEEALPEGAEDNIWNGVRYDEARFLVRVKLFLDGGELRTETRVSSYDGNGVGGGR